MHQAIPQPMARTSTIPQNQRQKRLLRAAGSTAVSLGNWASEVRVLPNLTLTRDWAFMAQPLALRMGPRSRLRSLRQAMNMDGPEIRSSTTATMRRNCHQVMPLKAATIPARAAPIRPRAMPTAAKMPAYLAISKGWALGLPSAAVCVASVRPAMDFSFFSAAFLSMRSLTMRATFL